VLVLSWSRAVYARFAFDQTLESFLRGHVEAFAALGGVPRTLLYDNLKSVVLEGPVSGPAGRAVAVLPPRGLSPEHGMSFRTLRGRGLCGEERTL
jgi:transposase